VAANGLVLTDLDGGERRVAPAALALRTAVDTTIRPALVLLCVKTGSTTVAARELGAALPPGTLVVVFSPLLDPRGFGAITDLRQRGFPLIVVDTLRDEPPPGTRAQARLALRLWRLDRAATRTSLRNLGIPVLRWPESSELDSVLAPLRTPPPGARRLAGSRP